MKLRNKKTGLVIDVDFMRPDTADSIVEGEETLKKLVEEWEDYKEPDKRQFIVSDDGEICPYMVDYINEGTDRGRKSIGNYFETREEAECAVEKLKAWKRLKDAGAEFYGWRRNQTGTYELYMHWSDRVPRSYEIKKALNLLFGGEKC